MNIKNDTFFDEINIIMDASIEGILLLEEGFISNVNTSLVKMLEYENKSDLVGNLATGCLVPSFKEKYVEYNNNVFQELFLLTKEGNNIPSIITIKDICIKNKDFKMVCVLDLSELKKKEAIILKQSRFAAMGEMIAMISHQWKQPLTALSAAITHIQMKIHKKDVPLLFLENKVKEMNVYLQYASSTINTFTGFFQDNKNKKSIYIYDLLEIMYKILFEGLKNENITLHIEKKNLSKLYIHENELLEVLINIVNNARDAFQKNEFKNKNIFISYEENEKEQIIYIKDNAKGIEKSVIDKIFDPYFTTKKELNGAGLGLYMSKMIIEKHYAGKLLVKNVKDGCLFTIILLK